MPYSRGKYANTDAEITHPGKRPGAEVQHQGAGICSTEPPHPNPTWSTQTPQNLYDYDATWSCTKPWTLGSCTLVPPGARERGGAALAAGRAVGGGLDVALQHVQQRDRVGQPVRQAGVVVRLRLYLRARSQPESNRGFPKVQGLG